MVDFTLFPEDLCRKMTIRNNIEKDNADLLMTFNTVKAKDLK
jgi:hypothetical protein